MLLAKGDINMEHMQRSWQKVTPFTKVKKPEDKPKFEVTNRKERRRLKSRKAETKTSN